MDREIGAGKVVDVEEVPPGLEEGPGAQDGDGVWSPIRVAFTTWKVGLLKPKKFDGDGWYGMPSWDRFSGYSTSNDIWVPQSEITPSFLGQCYQLEDKRGKFEGSFGRFLHREEMNLKRAGEYLEMYDRLVGRQWKNKSGIMDFLNKNDHLPLVHIVVNNSDSPNKTNRGRYDLFFPHERHFGGNDSIYYMNEHEFSKAHQKERKVSAEFAGACPHCAIEMDQYDNECKFTHCTVYHIRAGYHSSLPTDEVYGYRGYGQEITDKNANEKRSGGIIVNLPKGNQVKKIFLPRDVVHKVSGKDARWGNMKIFPESDIPRK